MIQAQANYPLDTRERLAAAIASARDWLLERHAAGGHSGRRWYHQVQYVHQDLPRDGWPVSMGRLPGNSTRTDPLAKMVQLQHLQHVSVVAGDARAAVGHSFAGAGQTHRV